MRLPVAFVSALIDTAGMRPQHARGAGEEAKKRRRVEQPSSARLLDCAVVALLPLPLSLLSVRSFLPLPHFAL
jgi:hypothetical protein